MVRAPQWMVRAPQRMVRAPQWMLKAPQWMLRAPPMKSRMCPRKLPRARRTCGRQDCDWSPLRVHALSPSVVGWSPAADLREDGGGRLELVKDVDQPLGGNGRYHPHRLLRQLHRARCVPLDSRVPDINRYNRNLNRYNRNLNRYNRNINRYKQT
eukprot:1188227-Prorocentrum_minimum.AAC.1